MKSWVWGAVAVLVTGCAVASGPALADPVGAGVSTTSGSTTGTVVQEAPAYTFVSAPDFLNADMADVSGLSTWDGVHNSWNGSYAASLDVILDQLAAEAPDDVLVAGDTVEGHWGTDVDGTGIFGPVGTTAERLQAVRNAGDLYYGAWVQRFRDHGLPVPHVTVGDHEIGDNAWGRGTFKYAAFGTFKHTFARHLIGSRYRATHRPQGTAFSDTSYWTALSPEVLLVSVDVFRRHDRNVSPQTKAVTAELSGKHLRWFEDVLRRKASRYPWVIVQAHTPIAGPVRSEGSSKLMLAGGTGSAMWKAMDRYGVDLYLAGEVHQDTAIDRRAGPVQISHGGLMSFGRTRYLSVHVFDDRMEISSFGFQARVDDSGERLWQTSSKRAVPGVVEYLPGAVRLGTAVLTPNRNLRRRTGDLAPAAELGR
ncbi:metallophosphoesterase family protein [Nocardioides mesophilus]|uniref:Metallophosphoesterase n=1 Tax=Nocardioides mesophilus TaxID=433659 RepID=A0A7G9R7A6_9ACTN|nr:metallophosphoesterase [Nocardioides mesophilus]QNN51481.1 metallophosphoesterase [Nocardioides mesophilus]